MSLEPETPLTGVEHERTSARKAKWGKPVGLTLGLLVAVAAGTLTLRKNGDAAPRPPAAMVSDTPRVQGDRIEYSEQFAKHGAGAPRASRARDRRRRNHRL